MSDIANLKHRLRSEIPQRGDISLQELAASGIEQLETEIERLKAALKPFAKMYAAPGGDLDQAIQAARAALEPKP